MSVDIIIEDTRWKGLEGVAATAVPAVLDHLGLDPEVWEVTVLGCDDARIAQLNAVFRNKPKATNVLSWPSEDRSPDTAGAIPSPPSGDTELGDIALSYETCMSEAETGEIPPDHHVTHLIVHGVLHLLGYDHERNRDADLMESLETAILCKLGVPDPYMVNGQTGPDS